MPPRIRLFFSSFTGVLFILAALPIYRELTRPRDIWWTPHAMLVPLAESRDRVEIYARGRPLDALLEGRELRIGDEAGSSVLAIGEIGLRFNNWDRVRAQRLPLLLGSAAGCGALALLFFLAVTGRLAYRGETQATAS